MSRMPRALGAGRIVSLVPRARRRWAALWDGEIHPWAYAIFRIGLAALVLARTTDVLRPLLDLAHHGWVRGLEYAPWAEAVEEPALHSPLVPGLFDARGALASALVVARTVLAVLLLVGVRPRASALLLGVVGYALMAADRYRYFHHLHLLYITCLLLALAPSGERGSIERLVRRGADRVAKWPLQVLRAQALVAYAASGGAKLAPAWLDGSVLARLEEAGLFAGPAWDLGVGWLGHPGMAVAIVAWELLLVPLLAWRRTRLPAIALGVALHLLIGAVTTVSTFGAVMLLYLAMFLPWGVGATPPTGALHT